METQIIPAKWDVEAPSGNFQMAKNVAQACKEIVVKSAVDIRGKKYIPVEGWQSIALTHGCVASSRAVERVYDAGQLIGYKAVGEVRLMANGQVIAEAEGFVGLDEKKWRDSDEYACRAMAQTRAISRACRSAFAHIVLLMNANLQTCPREEVPSEGFEDAAITEHEAQRELDARANSAPVEPQQTTRQYHLGKPRSSTESNARTEWEGVVIHFGKNKGIRLGDLEPQQLRWYQKEWQPRPFRGRISDADQSLRDALNESMGVQRDTLAIGTQKITNSIDRSDLYVKFADYIKSEFPDEAAPKVFAEQFCRELGKLLGKSDALTSLDALTDAEVAQAWDMRGQAGAILRPLEEVPF